MCLVVVVLATLSAPQCRWREIAANGTWPTPRFSHTAVLSADGRRMLLFGGNNFDAVNELFSFDIGRREWSRVKPEGAPPSKRYGHAAIATTDGRMLIFGGFNGTFLDDVHELTLGDDDEPPRWRRVDTSGSAPSARDGHSAALAPDGVAVLIFGGFDGERQLADLHALDTASFQWQELEAGTADEAATATADDAGIGSDAAAAAVEVRPQPRYMHSAVCCGGSMLVYGGYLADGAFASDLWKLSFHRSSFQHSEEGASGKASGGKGFTFAGVAANGPRDDAGRPLPRGPARWERVIPTGEAPGPLFGHAAAADSEGRMWVFGGFGAGSFSGHLHVLEMAPDEPSNEPMAPSPAPAPPRWSLVRARGKLPSPRHKHTLVAAPAHGAAASGELLLFGGNDFGPTRGFFELGLEGALEAILRSETRGAARAAVRLVLAQLLQLVALVALTVLSSCVHWRILPDSTCALGLATALACLFGAERVAPAPGALLARLQRALPVARARRTAADATALDAASVRSRVGHARSRLSMATDVAAALAAASLTFAATTGRQPVAKGGSPGRSPGPPRPQSGRAHKPPLRPRVAAEMAALREEAPASAAVTSMEQEATLSFAEVA